MTPAHRIAPWAALGAAGLLLVVGVAGIGGLMWYRATRADDGFRIEGLPRPTVDLQRVATAATPPGTRSVAATADDTTVYYVAVGDATVTIGADPIVDSGHRWQVDGPAPEKQAVPRVALVGSMLIVTLRSDTVGRRMALRTSDGSEAWSESWPISDGSIHAAADGTDLITTRTTDDGRSSVISRVDATTGAATWTYPIAKANVVDISVRLSWFGGPGTATPHTHLDRQRPDLRDGLPADVGTIVAIDDEDTVHVLDGATGKARATRTLERMTDVTVFGDAVYVLVDTLGATTVVALDPGTLAERWRQVVLHATRIDPCGPTLLCVPTDDAKVEGLDAGTGAETPVVVPGDVAVFALTPVGGRVVASLGNETPAPFGRPQTIMVDSVSPWRGTRLRLGGDDLSTLAVGDGVALVGRFSTSTGPGEKPGYEVSVVDVANLRASRAAVLDMGRNDPVTVAGRHIVAWISDVNQLVVLRNPFAQG